MKGGSVEKTCKCGTRFTVYPYRAETALYCSPHCKGVFSPHKSGYKSPAGSRAKLGTKNPMWSEKPQGGVRPLHTWVRRRLPKPLWCERCGEEKKLELSNKGHTYRPILSDWWWLCKKCHYKFDGAEKYLRIGWNMSKSKAI